MSGNNAVPEVLWTPSAERVARAAITDFTSFVAERTGRTMTDYESLWEYSTAEPAGFWGDVADYFHVKWHTQPTDVLAESTMPGAEWFPGGTLNYAEHALAGSGSRHPAVITISEDGTEHQLTPDELRRQV